MEFHPLAQELEQKLGLTRVKVSFCKFGAGTRKHTHIWTCAKTIIGDWSSPAYVCSGDAQCACYGAHDDVRGASSEATAFPMEFARALALKINVEATGPGRNARAVGT